MTRLGRVLSWLGFAAACLMVALAIALFAAEQSGFLRGELQSRIGHALGVAPGDLQIDAARLRWFRPGVELDGLRIGPIGADGNAPLAADRIWIDLDIAARDGGPRVRLARAEVRGLRVRLGHPFWSAGTSAPSDPNWLLEDQHWPTISIRDAELEWEDDQLGRIPLGSFDAWLSPRGDPVRTLRGLWRPSFVASTKPVAWRAEVLPEGGPVAVRATLRDAELEFEALPAGPLTSALRRLAPRGTLSADITGSLPRAERWEAMRPEGALHLELRSGSLRHPVTEARIDLDTLTARGELGARSWGLQADAAGRFGAAPLELALHAGPSQVDSAALARIALRAQDVPLTSETLSAAGLPSAVRRIHDGVQPRGHCDLRLDGLLPRATGAAPEVLVELITDGRAALAYRGLANPLTGDRKGFPLPVTDVAGSVLVLHTPDAGRRDRVALPRLRARHEYGSAAEPARALARGLFVAPHREHGSTRPEVLLEVDVADLVADDALRDALAGLPGTDWIWPTLRPQGGRADGRFRLELRRSFEKPVSHVALAARDLTLAWNRVPIPYRAAELDLALLFDRGIVASVASHGSSRTVGEVEIPGHVWTEPTFETDGVPLADALSSWIDVELGDIALRGEDVDVLAAALPPVREALAAAGGIGKIDARLRLVRPLPMAQSELSVEALPRQVEFLPRAFPVRTSALEGRVIVDARLAAGIGGAPQNGAPDRFVARLAPLVGEWSAGARVAAVGTIDTAAPGPGEAPSQLTLRAARVRTADRNLTAAIAELFDQPGRSAGFAALDLGGRVDCAGVIALGNAGGGRSSFRAHLRGNDLTFASGAGPALRRLTGPLEISPDGFYCAHLRAQLARTPIAFEDLLVEGGEGGGFRVRTGVRAEGLPLDREHLSWLLDDGALDALVEEFRWRGEVDLVHTTVHIEGRPTGELEVDFHGRLLFSDLFLLAGVPVRVSSAFADVRSFVYESGAVRAWAELSDLFGSLANRPLDDARLVVSYVTPRVNVLELDGLFAGGRVRGLQSASTLTGPVLSLDLEHPFRFELGVGLDGVEVGTLLEGLVDSTTPPRGVLEAAVRLSGNFENLVDLRGSGQLSLAKARLWSLPVVRVILYALGAEDSAVFDEIFARFQLEEGRIHMSDLRLSSPLLNLIGFGTLDLDGSLSYELQVRYSLVDKLGPLTRLLYWVQNNLISVSVRGDMSRPQVIFRGVLGLFRSKPSAGRDLPLPSYSPLPERF